MDRIEFPSIILDQLEDTIYLADMDTYELYYLNQSARTLYGGITRDEYWGKPCYEVLQHRDSPCKFCTNHMLREDRYYTWEHYNPLHGQYFSLKDKAVRINGRRVRLEVCSNITKDTLAMQHLEKRLSIEQTLVKCIDTLKNDTDIQSAIQSLLYHVSCFYSAERAYIFEIDHEKALFHNTYEWCKEGVTPQIQSLQCLPIVALDRWLEKFEQSECIFLTDIEHNLDENSLEYQILAPQGIKTLIAAPLINSAGDILGLIGVDNPASNTESAMLLTSISNFILEDIKKRRLLQQLEEMSYVDPLTGLFNRNKYIQSLQELQKAPPEFLGVAYVDINGLKIANDTYGHQYGDFLITRAAELLRGIFSDQVYRIGGDEFVALCAGIGRKDFEAMSAQLRAAVEADEDCSLSIGTKWDQGRHDILEQIIQADELMYSDKQSYYKSISAGKGRVRSTFAQELIHAIEDGEYEVFFQPKVQLKTGAVIGAEALIRKVTPDGIYLSPKSFLPLLEAEGVIRHIDCFVLQTVLATLKSWQEAGMRLIQIAVNVSPLTLIEHDIVPYMTALCREAGVSPEWIIIEVTESICSIEASVLEQLSKKLTQAGFSLALDDFGVQYSNMATLASVGFSELKLDKSFLDEITSNDKLRFFLDSILDKKLLHQEASVAEGIETQQQLELLDKLNCESGQGHLFSKPIPIAEFEATYMQPSQKP